MSVKIEHSISQIFKFTKRIINDRRCKVIITLGPASSEYDVILELIKAGADIIRLNFSHGSHKEHESLIEKIRRASHEAQRNIAILQDLQGPKIRCTRLKNAKLDIKKDNIYKLSYDASFTFIAGILIAETEYRNQIEDSIHPFQGLFLGLFFLSVGMSIDIEFIKDKF